MQLGNATSGSVSTENLPSAGLRFTAVSPSTTVRIEQSARPVCTARMQSSRVFSGVMVALGAKLRAASSCPEPMSTATRTSGLSSSAQRVGSKPFLHTAPKPCMNTGRLKPMARARLGVGVSEKARSTLPVCSSITELP